MAPLRDIAWGDPLASTPACLTIVITLPTFPITNGIAMGSISFAVLKLVSERANHADWLLYALAAAFVARFIWVAGG